VDDHLDSPEPLPPEVLDQITGDIGSELSTYGCFEEKLEDVMEGKTIVIGPKGKTGFLVRPKS